MGKRIYIWALSGWTVTFALMMASVWGLPLLDKPVAKKPDTKTPIPGKPQPTLPAPQDSEALTARFEKEIWPLLSRKESGCLTCHDMKATNPLHLFPDARSTFKTLLTTGHFEPENPGSILARVTAPDKARRMPPDPHPLWTDEEAHSLRVFVFDLYEALHKSSVKPDEIFPPALLAKYSGKLPSGGPDNTFLTYYQLRGKIKSIFGDEWTRNGRDLFNDNVALFNGADFQRRFDEPARASASFLTGLEMMARDVSSRTYFQRSGPFTGHPDAMPSPLSLTAPDTLYRREIDRLYNRLLFRSATETEMKSAFGFIQGVYRQQAALAAEDQDASFELTVRDEQGRTTTQGLTVRLLNSKLGCYQEYVNQSEGPQGNLVKKQLGDKFTLKAGDTEQRLEISNRGTNGLVSIHAVELRGPLPADKVTKIEITDPSVQPQGAWVLADRGGVKAYEDGNDNKGKSSLVVPLNVTQNGPYEVSLWWRKAQAAPLPGQGRRRGGGHSADNVPVEIYSYDKNRLAPAPAPPVPPKGQAFFYIDLSDDTKPHVELATDFRFGENDGVEINNQGTLKPVVADAVRFLPVQGGDNVVVTGDKAEGKDGWSEYNPGQFNYYRKISNRLLFDGNSNKGERKLLYKPVDRKDLWKPDRFYRVQVCYPGRDGNESRAPIIVHAAESAPIVQIAYPYRATVGGTVTLDASASYNLQQSKLTFTWRQIGGPRIALKNTQSPTVAFTAPTMTAQQAAWEGLCRALMKHPDFLFSRPVSLATTTNPKERKRLQLVKIAQDLLGRTPSAEELRKLDTGTPLSSLVDAYLSCAEFRDFYFRRIRLYLESRGSEVDDEPTRLWAYVVFNDRPFQEILTADYTVDARMRRDERPAYHGKTGLLTMKGFLQGKPGLPHFNYAGQVLEKFMGYVFEVPPEVVAMRTTITAVSTTNPNTLCYSCHKVLTPLAYQRLRWTDEGDFLPKDDDGKTIDDSDRKLVASYPFKGQGMEAFATQAVKKERFLRTILQTHFVFYFGREMRYQSDERRLYKRLWDRAHASNFALRPVLKTLLTSPEYLNGTAAPPPPKTSLSAHHKVGNRD